MLRISHPDSSRTLHTGVGSRESGVESGVGTHTLHNGHMSKIGRALLHFAPHPPRPFRLSDVTQISAAKRGASRAPPRHEGGAPMRGAEATKTRHRSGNFVHQHPFRCGALECPEISPPFKTFTVQTWLELPVAQAQGPLIHFQNSAR